MLKIIGSIVLLIVWFLLSIAGVKVIVRLGFDYDFENGFKAMYLSVSVVLFVGLVIYWMNI